MTDIIYMLVSVLILCTGFYLGRLTPKQPKQSVESTHNTHIVKRVYNDISDGIMKPDRDIDDDSNDNIFFK